MAYNKQSSIKDIQLESTTKVKHTHIMRIENADAAGQKLKINQLTFNLEMAPKFSFVKNLEVLSVEKEVASNIVPRESRLDIKMNGKSPALVGEWFDLELEIYSNEVEMATNIEVIASKTFSFID